MKDQCYLVVSEKRGVISMTKKPPKLAGDQRAIKVDVEVPSSFFEYTFVRRDIKITDEELLQEPDITVEVTHAAKRL